jgi:VanZ family protein
MRSMLILVCCGAILVFTCTASFHDLILFGSVRFQWNGHPQFSEFLSPFPFDLSHEFLIQKFGHIAAFLIFTLLLLIKIKFKIASLFMATSFAALTEILQLYFNRGGRIFDIGFDLIGIFIALGIASLFRKSQSNSIYLRN